MAYGTHLTAGGAYGRNSNDGRCMAVEWTLESKEHANDQWVHVQDSNDMDELEQLADQLEADGYITHIRVCDGRLDNNRVSNRMGTFKVSQIYTRMS